MGRKRNGGLRRIAMESRDVSYYFSLRFVRGIEIFLCGFKKRVKYAQRSISTKNRRENRFRIFDL